MPRFDWDEARSRYASGERVADLATEYGVSLMAIYRVLKPETRERMNRTKDEWQRSGACPDCGAQTTRRPHGYESRCERCAAIARASTVRDAELQCLTCGQWKPDDAFPHHRRRIARRGRHKQCRVCLTVAKRLWRERNPEKARAGNRRDYERKRAKAA